MVRIHFIIVMIRWTGLAPWEFEFPFPCSLTSTFLGRETLIKLYSKQVRGNATHGVSAVSSPLNPLDTHSMFQHATPSLSHTPSGSHQGNPLSCHFL